MAAITYSATEDAFMFGEFDTGIPSSAAVRWSTESKPAPVVWMKRMDGIRSRQKASTYGWGRREQKRLRALCRRDQDVAAVGRQKMQRKGFRKGHTGFRKPGTGEQAEDLHGVLLFAS